MMNRISAEPSSSLQALATQTLVDTSKYYCPFLDRGFCRESARCNFSHDCQASTKIPNDYCHFYLANQCLYGQDCKFFHGEPNEEPVLLDNFANISLEVSYNSADEFVTDDCDEDEYADADGDANAADDEDGCEVRERKDGTSNRIHDYHHGAKVYGRLDEVGMDSDDPDTYSQHNNNDNNGSDYEALSVQNRFIGFIGCVQERSEASAANQQQNTNINHAPTSKFRGTISHRCTAVDQHPYATSTSKLSQESAQSSSSGTAVSTATTPSTSNTSMRSSASTSSKPPAKTWQGARLIASIRNNNLASENAQETKAGSSRKGGAGCKNADGKVEDAPLCPYSLASGDCPFPFGHCSYLHGEVCDLCYSPCLHPFNEAQRLQHRDECLREHEREMELSFAVQRSKDKVCGICMDTVVEKKPITSSRFGILEKCSHIFCLDCIRKWRGTKQFDNRTIRACPECRVSSDFVVPSKYWVEDQDDKDKLIQEYKSALRAKPCRYFNEGKGECPFAGSCFYRHAYPDGRLAVLETPKPRRRLYGARGLASHVANYIFWNFITATDDDLSDDGVDSFYDWEIASAAEDDEDDLRYRF